MNPYIDGTNFGSITIAGKKMNHDVLIRLDGKIKKRKKKLSKKIYGTSHTISLEEAQYVFEEGAETLILGSGQFGMVHLSDQAAEFFSEAGCQIEIYPTPEAIKYWNKITAKAIGLFHITC